MSLLEIRQLSVVLPTKDHTVRAVTELSLTIERGETVALVGESGSGKSMTARALMGLLPPPGKISSGSIRFDGAELVGLDQEQMRSLRGSRLAMIFQEPMTSLNPVLKIGDQLAEPLRLHRRMDRTAAREEAQHLLQQVGIANPASRLRDYPHQLSGGQRQRVMIAMALACAPDLLIADEPTTALDVTIQAQILALIDRLRREQGLALLLITHDLGIVAERADRVHVMYAGRIVESAPTGTLLTSPAHPYSQGLLASLPANSQPGQPLAAIGGQPPNLALPINGCPFHPRCPVATPRCAAAMPAESTLATDHTVRCWNYL